MFRYISSVIVLTLGMGLPLPVWASTELLMAEEPGCIWCARWNAEIGPSYDKTGEGRAAPLRRADITEPKPDDINLARPVNFTPTFILLVNGEEVDRIEGYPGEDFFWPLLGLMLEEHGVSFTPNEEAIELDQ
jgi:hypothetical protein